MKTLEDLFLDELQDIYDAEHRISKALPKMAKAATDIELKAAFTAHLTETRGHIEKVAQVFEIIGEKAKRKTCQATVGLLKEGDEIVEEFADSPAINAALIAAAQKVEHYETASYGCLKEWARLLGHADAADLLGEVLSQEEAANDKLTKIAEDGGCNARAMSKEGDDARDAPAPKKKTAKR
ncbi:MAG: ferritin-like domain-containing protein [Opitutus sp.]